MDKDINVRPPTETIALWVADGKADTTLIAAPTPDTPSHSPRYYRRYRAFSYLALLVSLLFFLWVMVLLALNYFVLPHSAQIVQRLSMELYERRGIMLTVKSAEGDLVDFNPRLVLSNVSLTMSKGDTPILMDKVEARLSWQFLMFGKAVFQKLYIEGLSLSLYRDRQRVIGFSDNSPKVDTKKSIAKSTPRKTRETLKTGAPKVTPSEKTAEDGASDNRTYAIADMLDWLMSQKNIAVKGVAINWVDAGKTKAQARHWQVGGEFVVEKDFWQTKVLAKIVPPNTVSAPIALSARVTSFSAYRLADTVGEVSFSVKNADWAELTYFLPPEQALVGKTDFTLWLAGKGDGKTLMAMDTEVENLQWMPLSLPIRRATGEILAVLTDNILHVDGSRFRLKTEEGEVPLPTQADITLSRSPRGYFNGVAKADILLPSVEIPVVVRMLRRLVQWFPEINTLEKLSPVGTLHDSRFVWQAGESEATVGDTTESLSDEERSFDINPSPNPARFSFHGLLDKVGWNAWQAIPGVEGLSAELMAGVQDGKINFNTKALSLSLPNIMYEGEHNIERLTGSVRWEYQQNQKNQQKLGGVQAQNASSDFTLWFDKIAFSNRDGIAEVEGYFRQTGDKPYINLTGTLTEANGRNVWRYMPKAVSKDAVDWLKAAIVGGISPLTRLTLRGDLRHFPFTKNTANADFIPTINPEQSEEIFQVLVPFRDAALKFQPDWPSVEDAAGILLFEGDTMNITVTRGFLSGANAEGTKVSIPSLSYPILVIDGLAKGKPEHFQNFMQNSPLSKVIPGLSEVKAVGDTKLDLHLELPLEGTIENYVVKGVVTSSLSSLQLSPILPEITQVNNTTAFDQNGVIGLTGTGTMLSTPIVLKDSGVRGESLIDIPSLDTSNLLAWKPFVHPWGKYLSGTVSANGKMMISERGFGLQLRINTTDCRLSLPSPYSKEKGVNWPLWVRVENPSLPSSQTTMQEKKRYDSAKAESVKIEHTVDSSPWLYAIDLYQAPKQKIYSLLGRYGAPTHPEYNAEQKNASPSAVSQMVMMVSDGKTPTQAEDEVPALPDNDNLSNHVAVDTTTLLSSRWPSKAMIEKLPPKGLALWVDLQELAIDSWLPYMGALSKKIDAEVASNPSHQAPEVLISVPSLLAVNNPLVKGEAKPFIPEDEEEESIFTQGTMRIAKMKAFGQVWHGVSARIHPPIPWKKGEPSDIPAWNINVESVEAKGRLWLTNKTTNDNAKKEALWVRADFERLLLTFPKTALPSSSSSLPSINMTSDKNITAEPSTTALSVVERSDDGMSFTSPSTFPFLEIAVESLTTPTMGLLGKLTLKGEPEEKGYRLTSLTLNEGGDSLSADGFSHADTQKTVLRLTAKSNNLGHLLRQKWGMTQLDEGNFAAKGLLEWNGGPFDINPTKMAGEAEFTLTNGRFLEIEPGVGRLLGLLSLQEVFRRISFDFSDSLKKGFVFDSITAHLNIHDDLLSTKDMVIVSPAAKVLIQGQVKGRDETADIEMIVLPNIGGGVASGVAFFVSPITGVITWVAQKVVGNPFDQAFAKKLVVTGAWTNPSVVEVPYNPAITPMQNFATAVTTVNGVDSNLGEKVPDHNSPANLVSTPSNHRSFPSQLLTAKELEGEAEYMKKVKENVENFNSLRPIGFRAECR